MKTGKTRFISGIGRTFLGALALVVLISFALPQSASANSGADATILNVVRVDYTDASGNQSFAATASASVTINLVEAALTISGRPDATSKGDTAAQPTDDTATSGAIATYLFALTADTNGDDIYDLIVAKGTVANVASDAVSYATVQPDGVTPITASPASVTLGASVVSAVTNGTTLEFPGGTLDNIAVNDIVVIKGVDYKVTGVTVGSGGSHDNLGDVDHSDVGNDIAEVKGELVLATNAAGSNTAPSFDGTFIGELVAEQILLKVDVTAEATGAADGEVPFTINTDTVVNGTAGDANATAQITITTTFTGVQLTIKKEVRSYDLANTTWSAWGATATGNPGDTLEYRVTISNTANGSASGVNVTEVVPAYTTLVVDGSDIFATVNDETNTVSLTTATDSETQPGVGSEVGFGQVDGTDGDATDAGSPITFYIGTDSTNALGGNIASGATYTLIYQVTIN